MLLAEKYVRTMRQRAPPPGRWGRAIAGVARRRWRYFAAGWGQADAPDTTCRLLIPACCSVRAHVPVLPGRRDCRWLVQEERPQHRQRWYRTKGYAGAVHLPH